MDKLYHSPLFEHIRGYILNALVHETIFLFVPYIQAEILEKLLDGLVNKAVIITTWEPRDLLSGASDLAVYQFCRERRIALYVSEKTHLKVYSVGLISAVVATGNASWRGLMEGGNYEAAVLVDRLTNVDRFFFETIRANARLVDDAMYSELKAWVQLNTTNAPGMPDLKEVISEAGSDAFLISALPMTHSVGTLAAGYARIRAGQDPSDDRDVTTCIFHDLANYSIPMGLSDSEFRRDLSASFPPHINSYAG